MKAENDNFEIGGIKTFIQGHWISNEVHRNLGPGLLESAYQNCLLYELKAGLKVEKEIPL
jgi:GxxExxY protein